MRCFVFVMLPVETTKHNISTYKRCVGVQKLMTELKVKGAGCHTITSNWVQNGSVVVRNGYANTRTDMTGPQCVFSLHTHKNYRKLLMRSLKNEEGAAGRFSPSSGYDSH